MCCLDIHELACDQHALYLQLMCQSSSMRMQKASGSLSSFHRDVQTLIYGNKATAT